jgi:hypothetical protein
VQDRTLTIHEAVHCQNVREMIAGGDWVIPTYGGRPWLERPPLPHWATAAFVLLTGQPAAAWAYRLSAACAAYLVVLLAAWVASVWYGRRLGLLAGVVLATMIEFNAYATAPECDIFLCLIVTSAIALFVRLEFVQRRAEEREGVGFVGWRSWAVLAFFVVAGLANVAKGLIFGDLFIFSTVLAFLLWNANLRAARATPGCGLAGVRCCCGTWRRRLPRIRRRRSLVLRLPRTAEQGVHAPAAHYYLMQMPRVLLPWTLLAVVGLFVTARARGAAGSRGSAAGVKGERQASRGRVRQASGGRRRQAAASDSCVCGRCCPSRCCRPATASTTIICCTAWRVAILGAVGAVRVWEFLTRDAARAAQPGRRAGRPMLPVDVALWVLRHRVPGPEWLVPGVMVAWPVLACAVWWAATRPDARLAALSVCSLIVAGHLAGYVYHTAYNDRYLDDRAFVARVREAVPAERSVVVVNDVNPLYGSWFLFYLDRPTVLLHNPTFLRSDRLRDAEVYLVMRAEARHTLTRYGAVTQFDQSCRTRGEAAAAERWTLFHLALRDDLKRLPGDVRISPMQATDARGAVLSEDVVAQQARAEPSRLRVGRDRCRTSRKEQRARLPTSGLLPRRRRTPRRPVACGAAATHDSGPRTSCAHRRLVSHRQRPQRADP